ncbi:MAG: tetratricopeptide repeat protein [Gemmataceae bacterium]
MNRASRISVILLLTGGVAAWWFLGRNTPPAPPLPAGIEDVEVRTTLERARERVVQNPDSGDEWGEYGSVLLANLFDREADQCFIRAIKLAPNDPRWPYARGQIALKRDPPAALGLLEKAAELATSSPRDRQPFGLTLAEALLERGETDRAAMLFESLKGPPEPARAEFGLGLCALVRDDTDDAARRFEAAAKHSSCRKQVKAHLARLARVRGDADAAKRLEAEEAALDPDPPWPDPYLDRVVTLQVGARGLEKRITLLERDGKFEEAAELHLQQAASQRNARNLTGAAVNLARLGRYDEALSQLREAVKLDPADSRARYTLALVAFTKWEKAVDLAADAEGWREGFREVIEQAKKTVELKPDHARAFLFQGLAFKHLNEPQNALAPLQQGVAIEPNNFELHLALGQVKALGGDRAGAKQAFETAASLRPGDPRPGRELERLRP